MTPEEIAAEAAKNAEMLSDSIMRKEWINSLVFRIDEYSQLKKHDHEKPTPLNP